MSLQAEIDNLQEETGNGPADWMELAEQRGFTKDGKIIEGIKSSQVIEWLQSDFDLDHERSKTVYAILKGMKGKKK